MIPKVTRNFTKVRPSLNDNGLSMQKLNEAVERMIKEAPNEKFPETVKDFFEISKKSQSYGNALNAYHTIVGELPILPAKSNESSFFISPMKEFIKKFTTTINSNPELKKAHDEFVEHLKNDYPKTYIKRVTLLEENVVNSHPGEFKKADKIMARIKLFIGSLFNNS